MGQSGHYHVGMTPPRDRNDQYGFSNIFHNDRGPTLRDRASPHHREGEPEAVFQYQAHVIPSARSHSLYRHAVLASSSAFPLMKHLDKNLRKSLSQAPGRAS